MYNPLQNERRGRDRKREIEKSHTFSDPLGSEATGRHAEESVFTDTGCNSSEQYFFFVRTSSCHTHTHTQICACRQRSRGSIRYQWLCRSLFCPFREGQTATDRAVVRAVYGHYERHTKRIGVQRKRDRERYPVKSSGRCSGRTAISCTNLLACRRPAVCVKMQPSISPQTDGKREREKYHDRRD